MLNFVPFFEQKKGATNASRLLCTSWRTILAAFTPYLVCVAPLQIARTKRREVKNKNESVGCIPYRAPTASNHRKTKRKPNAYYIESFPIEKIFKLEINTLCGAPRSERKWNVVGLRLIVSSAAFTADHDNEHECIVIRSILHRSKSHEYVWRKPLTTIFMRNRVYASERRSNFCACNPSMFIWLNSFNCIHHTLDCVSEC